MLVVDLGGQYSQLIARRVRECRVYSELVGHTITPEAVRARNPYAMILSGGPASVYAENAPHVYHWLGVAQAPETPPDVDGEAATRSASLFRRLGLSLR